MTTSVDVLAVLRQIADGEGDAQVLAMRVHSAIAELIEAADPVSEAAVKHYGNCMGLHLSLTGIGGLNERLAVALARVKGA